MNIIELIAGSERRLGPILFQVVLVIIVAIGGSHIPHSGILLFIIFPVGIGW